jgi:hypothetical protein
MFTAIHERARGRQRAGCMVTFSTVAMLAIPPGDGERPVTGGETRHLSDSGVDVLFVGLGNGTDCPTMSLFCQGLSDRSPNTDVTRTKVAETWMCQGLCILLAIDSVILPLPCEGPRYSYGSSVSDWFHHSELEGQQTMTQEHDSCHDAPGMQHMRRDH